MNKVWRVAVREFTATVFTKGFVVALLVMPAIIAIMALLGPRLIPDRDLRIEGEVAVIDATGVVLPRVRAALAKRASSTAVAEIVDRARAGGVDETILDVLGATTQLTLVARPADADFEREKIWLDESTAAPAQRALVVVQRNAVEPAAGETNLGSYDLYVPSKQDNRFEIAVQAVMRDAIIDARAAARGLDRAAIVSLMTVPRVQSVTVSAEGERGTVFGLNFILPFAFMFLLVMGVMFAGQGMLTTTIEEKSNRVIEVLLSAVSPMELMGGKLLGHMAISLLAMSLYLGLGLVALASFSLFGLIDLALLPYLFIFFLIAFFTLGSLMMAVGSAVNDMREAQSLMIPLTMTMIVPWALCLPIVRDPNSTLATIVSFVPPINSFGMLLRLTSSSPPPAWQVWLSIGVGVTGVVAAVWVAAKVFRIGILMFGKPPDLRTLIRWVRAA